MPNKANRQQQAKDVPPYSFSDEVTKRKMRRHIKDINDVITEKDIKNAKVPGAELLPVPSKPARKEKKPKSNVVDDTPGNPATPWDVLQ